MHQSLVDTARESAIRTLERAAFLFTDDIAQKEIPPLGEYWQQKGVSLDYRGPFQGELRLWMPESLSRMIASNMLGIDEGMDLAKQEEDDALKEILNIILGIYLTDAYGTEPIFHLGIPLILSPEQWGDSVRTEGCFWIKVEGEPVLMSVHGGE